MTVMACRSPSRLQCLQRVGVLQQAYMVAQPHSKESLAKRSLCCSSESHVALACGD